MRYIVRWNALQYARLKKSVAEVHDEINNGRFNPLEMEEKLKEYLDTYPQRIQDITNVLNFLEEISLCIQENIVDEKILYKFYRFIVIRYWNTFEPFVRNRRKKMDNQNIYNGLEKLCLQWSLETS